jgi:DNA-binding response OmpR family regulator
LEEEKKPLIYAAEDSPLQMELLRAILDKEDKFRTEFFADGLEIYRRIQEAPPDLLILDIILPSLSGLAISRLVKYHDQFSSIPLIMTSSITDPAIKETSSKSGADVFIPKPFKINELMHHIRRLLAL